MDKKIKFHQYIKVEKGPKNSAIINFIKGDVFQVENKYIEAFENKEYEKIPEFVNTLKEAELVIEVDESAWIPEPNLDNYFVIEDAFNLFISSKLDLVKVIPVFKNSKVENIYYYGKKKDIPKQYKHLEIECIKGDFDKCKEMSTVNSDFTFNKEIDYYFNKNYNSCWKKQLTIKDNGDASPCIFSDIVTGNIYKDKISDIITKMMEYWLISKDKIKKCKDCEMRFTCFDCRVIACQNSSDLYAENPNCNYEPNTGQWK